FVLQKLREKGLFPSPEADRVTLIRRLSFDLAGLPPALQEVDAFVNDKRGDAYEQLVDRLLGSPHFGGRMAMYWLDLVRYADHKDDPYTTRDFYSLAAFFADIQETAVGEQPGTKIPTPQQAAQLARLDEKLAPLRKALDTQTAEIEAAQVAWEESLRKSRIDW